MGNMENTWDRESYGHDSNRFECFDMVFIYTIYIYIFNLYIQYIYIQYIFSHINVICIYVYNYVRICMKLDEYGI